MLDAMNILLVARDPGQRRATAEALVRAGWRVSEAGSAEACLANLETAAEAIVLVDGPGDALVPPIAEGRPDVPILVTGPDDVAAATDALRSGAWDYVVARPDRAHLAGLAPVVARALERRRLVRDRNRLREEMEALAVALQRTTDGVAIVGAGGRISFANRALGEALGASPSQVVGRLLAEFVRVPGDDHALADILGAVVDRGRWSGVLEAHGAAPAQVVWEVSLTPLGGGTSPRSVVAIFRDVSEKHELEQMRADFLSMVTHDIKVPLTVILGYTEMLGDPEPPPDQVPLDVVARIRESGEMIHALVCNFLDLSRIEAGRFTIDPRPFELRGLLEHALEQHGASARRKTIALALDCAPVLALADEGQIERVVTNLLANAIKYTGTGGRVTVTGRREGDRIVLAFADTGRGIPAADIPHLFQRYRRVREAKRTEGTGLGLYIVKTIVDAHGGELRVESTPGVGSTFTVVIPAAEPEPAPRSAPASRPATP